MILNVVVPPAEEPVSVAEAKAHIYLCGDDGSEDAAIATMISAARAHVEEVAGLAILTQTIELRATAWPVSNSVTLPRYPLQSVESITYTDAEGNDYTVSADNYYVDTASEPGRVWVAMWPASPLQVGPSIAYRYVSGWATPEAVPAPIKSAILLIFGDLYANRERQIVGQGLTPIVLDAADRLLAQYRRVTP